MRSSTRMVPPGNGSMFDRFLHYYDQSALIYWGISGAVLALFILVALANTVSLEEAGATRRRFWNSETFFVLTMAAAVFAGRWPYLCFRHYFNPDESQQISGAITLSHDPHFWFSVDGHTAGPVDFYYLCSPAAWGGSIDYTSARLTALILIIATLYFSYRLLRLRIPTPIARIAIAPLVVFFSWVTDEDFVEISTEHMPVFLITAAAYFFLTPIFKSSATKNRTRWWLWAGLTAGLAPWAKLQASVSALAFVIAALIWALRQTEPISLLRKLRMVVPLMIGMALPTLFFGGLMIATGQCESFYRSYLAANLDYTYRGTAKFYILNQFWEDASVSGFFPILFLGAVAWVAAALITLRRRRQKAAPLLKCLLVYAAVSLLTVLSPGRPFLHYLLFLIPPVGLLAGYAWYELQGRTGEHRASHRLTSAFVGSFLALFLSARLIFQVPFEGNLQAEWNRPLSPPAAAIKSHLRAGDTIALWGWRPDLYVELQTAQGVRDAHTQREIEDTPFRPYYRARYLADLKRNRPLAFVDVVGPDAFVFLDRKRFGFEIFPELKNYVTQNYVLVSADPIGRVFVRKDRF